MFDLLMLASSNVTVCSVSGFIKVTFVGAGAVGFAAVFVASVGVLPDAFAPVVGVFGFEESLLSVSVFCVTISCPFADEITEGVTVCGFGATVGV